MMTQASGTRIWATRAEWGQACNEDGQHGDCTTPHSVGGTIPANAPSVNFSWNYRFFVGMHLVSKHSRWTWDGPGPVPTDPALRPRLVTP